MLLFDTVGRYVAYSVVCEKHNLLESEVSMLKPWTVLGRFGIRAHGNRPSATSPPKTVAFGVSTPSHIVTASITRHLAANQAHILQKLDTKIHVDMREITCSQHLLLQASNAGKMIGERKASPSDAVDILISRTSLYQPLFPITTTQSMQHKTTGKASTAKNS